MKKIFLILALVFSTIAYAENETFTIDEKLPNLDKIIITDKVQDNTSYWTPYMRSLEQGIKRNWIPPKDINTVTSSQIKVAFTIAKDGRLWDPKIILSSGNKKLDQSALKAVKLSHPFAPLPKEFDNYSIPVEFVFDITQYKK